MEMIGLPRPWLIRLLPAAVGRVALSEADKRQAEDTLARLLGTSKKATLDKPTGTAEKIEIEQEIHKASAVSATPSWSVSHG